MSKRIPSITQKQAAAFLQPRPPDSHKGSFGTVLVIGGATGMVGAALLAGRAALKLGAGCVHVGLLADNPPAVDMVQPELMLHSAPFALSQTCRSAIHRALTLCGTSPDKSGSYAHRCVLAIGCGMGTSKPAQKLLLEVIRLKTPLVLDADALNLLARHPDLQEDLRARKAPTVITPHPGEAARLLGTSTAAIQAARSKAAQQLAQKLHCSVVLKGAGSVCVTGNGKTYLNPTGNPGMSAPGMGDVLTGMIAAFIAQGLDADQALLLAVHLHGAAADALAEQGVAVGMTATDVTEWARWLVNQWRINS
jgi:hydroxyethylthiazole kinase-like uncharacterized protein yjeF